MHRAGSPLLCPTAAAPLLCLAARVPLLCLAARASLLCLPVHRAPALPSYAAPRRAAANRHPALPAPRRQPAALCSCSARAASSQPLPPGRAASRLPRVRFRCCS
ncbi:hypothetical protein PR202_ga07751 [Eleusine coracana subsp. coracana]|uniref:Secreted protein n=1 Tax=Eleusine coracana subsp. coracana TaxID=191504 RepID=A0AAV5BZJ5_ELECO|nr:hypothetical protein PR202_ga07751 [Eleusine coracana subsp. coracana]